MKGGEPQHEPLPGVVDLGRELELRPGRGPQPRRDVGVDALPVERGPRQGRMQAVESGRRQHEQDEQHAAQVAHRLIQQADEGRAPARSLAMARFFRVPGPRPGRHLAHQPQEDAEELAIPEPRQKAEHVGAQQVHQGVEAQGRREPAWQQLAEEFEPDERDVEHQARCVTPTCRVRDPALERQPGRVRHQPGQRLPWIDRRVEVADHGHRVRHGEHEADPEEGHVEIDERILAAGQARHDAEQQQGHADDPADGHAPMTVPGVRRHGTLRLCQAPEGRRHREQADHQERKQERPGRREGIDRERHRQGVGLGEDVRTGAAGQRHEQAEPQRCRLHR